MANKTACVEQKNIFHKNVIVLTTLMTLIHVDFVILIIIIKIPTWKSTSTNKFNSQPPLFAPKVGYPQDTTLSFKKWYLQYFSRFFFIDRKNIYGILYLLSCLDKPELIIRTGNNFRIDFSGYTFYLFRRIAIRSIVYAELISLITNFKIRVQFFCLKWNTVHTREVKRCCRTNGEM